MKYTAVIFFVMGLICSVKAQETLAPREQALGSKLMAEISAGVQCNTSLIVAQGRIAELEAKVKDLEAKMPTSEKK